MKNQCPLTLTLSPETGGEGTEWSETEDQCPLTLTVSPETGGEETNPGRTVQINFTTWKS